MPSCLPELVRRSRRARCMPDWLDTGRRRELLQACRTWARPPAGLRTVRTPGCGTMTARQVCLGRHWYPCGYARTVVDGDGAPELGLTGRLNITLRVSGL